MDPNLQALYAMAGGYQPTSVIGPMRSPTGFEGVPVPGGAVGQLAFNFIGQPYLQSLMGRVGMTPMGFSGQNPVDMMASMRSKQLQNEAIRAAAEFDRESTVRTLRGMAAITGTPWSFKTQNAANSIGAGLAAASPFLNAVGEDYMDALAGPEGAASVLAGRVFSAGRYRLDPVTGSTGMSPGLTARMAGAVVEDFRQGGYQGFSAGQVGLLFQEMQARGRMATSVGDYGPGALERERDLAVRSLTESQTRSVRSRMGMPEIGPLTSDEADKFGKSTEVISKIQDFDSQRVITALKSYTSAISAVRDIFGDMGRPNAPMRELMAGLEALTNGASSVMDPGRLAQTVRQTYNLAKMTGTPMANAIAMQQNASVMAGQLGLAPAFAMEATQAGLAAGGAYKAIGMGNYTAWGRPNEAETIQTQQNLTLRTAASDVGNRLGAFLRIEDAVGGFDPNSAAGALAASLRRKDRTGTFLNPETGKFEQINAITNDTLGRWLAGTRGRDGSALGISAGTVDAFIAQADQNQGAINQYGLAGNVLTAAGYEDLRIAARNSVRNTLNRNANQYGDRLGDDFGDEITQAFLGMSSKEVTDTKTRTELLATRLKDRLTASGRLNAVPEADRLARMRLLAGEIYGGLDQDFRESEFNVMGVKGAQSLHVSLDKSRINRQLGLETGASIRGMIQDSTSALQGRTFLSSLFGAIQEGRPLEEVLASAAGGVDIALYKRKLDKPLAEAARLRDEMNDLADRAGNTADPAAAQALRDAAKIKADALAKIDNELRDTSKRLGLGSEKYVGRDSIAAIKAERAVQQMADATAGFRTGRATGPVAPPTPAEVAAVQAKYGIDALEAEDVVLMRNRVAAAGADADVSKLIDEKTWADINSTIIAESGNNKRFAGYDQLAKLYGRFRRAGGTAPGTVRDAQGSVTMTQAQLDRYNQAHDVVARERTQKAGYVEDYMAAASQALDVAVPPGMQMRSPTELVVKKDARDAWLKTNGAGITKEQRDAVRAADPTLAAVSDQWLDQLIAQRGLLGAEYKKIQGNFDKLWASPEGDEFRRRASTMMSTTEAVVYDVLGTQNGARGGSASVEAAVSLQKAQDELHGLAAQHFGGSMSRLLAKDFAFDHINDQKRAADVTKRISELQKSRRTAIGTIAAEAKSPTLPTSEDEAMLEAAKLLGVSLPGTGPVPPDVDKLAASLLAAGQGLAKPEDEDAIYAAQEEMRRRAGVEAVVDQGAMATRLAKAYGFDATEGSAELKDLAAGLTAGGGAAFSRAREAIRTRETLSGAAKRGAMSVDDLTKAVSSAKTHAEVAALQKQLGVTGADWDAVQQSVDFQTRGTFKGAGDSVAALKAAVQGPLNAIGESQRRLTLDGTLTIQGNGKGTVAGSAAMNENGHAVKP